MPADLMAGNAVAPRRESGARAVFVVGKHRSGTTWLANQLCRHPVVAGVQHAAHAGIIESLFFSHIDGRFGDLRQWSNYVQLVETLVASTYFRVAGIERHRLYRLWPIGYGTLFRRIMDDFAARAHAEVWVEKSPLHTLALDRIAGLYPDARFVGIVRSRESVLASARERWRQRSANASRRLPGLARETWSWYVYNRSLRAFARREPRLLLVTYEEMLSDVAATMRRVCAHVGVPFDAAVTSSEYAPNTSFADCNAPQAMTGRDRAVVTAVSAAARLLPESIVHAVGRRRADRTHRPLPDWYFSMLADEVRSAANVVAVG